MNHSDNILLYTDFEKEEVQRQYLEQVQLFLTEVKQVFKPIGSFLKDDIRYLINGSAEDLIKSKLGDQINNVVINGIKIKSDKVIEMMDYEDFKLKFDSAKKAIKDASIVIISNSRMALEFHIDFFSVDDNTISIDEQFFVQWVEKKCRVYTKNEVQVSIFHKLSNFTDALNQLMVIRPSKDYDRSSMPFSTEMLLQQPKRIISEESYLNKLIKWDGKKFVVNNEFILSH